MLQYEPALNVLLSHLYTEPVKEKIDNSDNTSLCQWESIFVVSL